MYFVRLCVVSIGHHLFYLRGGLTSRTRHGPKFPSKGSKILAKLGLFKICPNLRERQAVVPLLGTVVPPKRYFQILVPRHFHAGVQKYFLSGSRAVVERGSTALAVLPLMRAVLPPSAVAASYNGCNFCIRSRIETIFI